MLARYAPGVADPSASSGLGAGAILGGSYVVERALSTGAMGEVHAAHHVDTGERVAVKRLLDPGNEDRFEIETRLLGQLAHPRIPRIVDSFVDGFDHYLVMEMVDGIDLRDALVERGDPGLPLDEAIGHMTEVCEALSYVHAQRIVHRDVKPSNVIVSDAGAVLVDFGIAREFSGIDEGTMLIGTPGFMAPEVISGSVVTPRSDVYGAAATLWMLLTGRPPSYGVPERLAEHAPDAPAELERVLRAALHADPLDRTPTVEAFAAALGVPLETGLGVPLVHSVGTPGVPGTLLEAVVRAAAGVFDAAAASIALTDTRTGGLEYVASWGAGAKEIVGRRLAPGEGIAGAVAAAGVGEAVAACRADPRFADRVAQGTGYVPITMLVVPLRRESEIVGVLSILDRRDGRPYLPPDVDRAAAFGDLAVMAAEPGPPGGFP